MAKMIAEEHNRLGRPLPINTLMVLNILRDSPRSDYISRADVVNLLHVKESKAYGLLKALADQGALAPVNKGRYAKYRLIR